MKKNNTVKAFRKQRARKIREGKGVQNNPDGSVSTHLMSTYTGENKRGRTVYYAVPSIAPTGEGGEYEDQSFDQALERGEVFEFRNERRAERFAEGSWKSKSFSEKMRDRKNSFGKSR